MSTEVNDLGRQIAELTRWPGGEPRLWRRALAATTSTHSTKQHRAWVLLRWPMRHPVAACVVPVLMALAIATSLPALSRVRPQALRGAAGEGETLRARRMETTPAPASPLAGTSISEGERARVGLLYLGAPLIAEGRGTFAARYYQDIGSAGFPTVSAGAGRVNPQQTAAVNAAGAPAERHVVRKATIELKTPDVHAVFLKAALLISEATGEYLEESSLTGTGKEAQANLTLRVAADRLDDVLNELRQLGEVRSEKVTGQDVTTQVVDLEARSRNEQRVEAELLELLSKRTDAPLKEVLELHGALGDIRRNIEQLTAQREQLGRLVSLATVLIIIRADQAPQPSPIAGLADYFGMSVGRAWHKGLRFLADTIAGLLSVLVGGLIWWVLLTVGLLLIARRYGRRAKSPTDGSVA